MIQSIQTVENRIKFSHLAYSALFFVFAIGCTQLLFLAYPQWEDPRFWGYPILLTECLFFVFLYYIIYKENLQFIFYRRNKFLLSGIVLCLIFYPIKILTETISHRIVVDSFSYPPYQMQLVEFLQELSTENFVLYAISIGIATPILEEILFRGLVQNYLSELIKPFFGIILTSLLFSFAHFDPSQGISNLEFLLPVFIISIFFGYVYQRTGSLFLCTGCHIINNLIELVTVFSID